MSEREYLAALCAFTYFGPARVRLLLNFFGSAKKAWSANSTLLQELGLNEKVVESFVKHRQNFAGDGYFNRLKKYSINFTTDRDGNYPENLGGIDGAPPVLYYIGKLTASNANAVAIVGSRKMSSYGREVAEKFAAELASLGITIVSGLALGIDAIAHRATIAVSGKGIVVLASGLDTISPLTNQWVAREIIKKGGAIVSEYPLGQPPFRTSFPSRNRIISGLSKAVVVIEGLAKSGTLLTASAAAEQGRSVFAVPGQITSPLSAAPNYLIQNGAKLATSVRDILNDLDLQLKVDLEEVKKVFPEGKNEEKLLEILTNEALHLDEVARISGLAVSEISARLTVMELKGIVKNVGNGVYKKI